VDSAVAELLVDVVLLDDVPLVLSSLSPQASPQWPAVDTATLLLPEDVLETDADLASL